MILMEKTIFQTVSACGDAILAKDRRGNYGRALGASVRRDPGN